jgi:hypothetical protein
MHVIFRVTTVIFPVRNWKLLVMPCHLFTKVANNVGSRNEKLVLARPYILVALMELSHHSSLVETNPNLVSLFPLLTIVIKSRFYKTKKHNKLIRMK